jgi:hypothetical protein
MARIQDGRRNENYTGCFLKAMISHNQLLLNSILFQSQVSAFMKLSSGCSYPRTE